MRFQYIQCYFLSRFFNHCLGFIFISIHPMLFFITMYSTSDASNPHFNTSNVIFYPTVLSHFLIIILHKSLYFSRFLLYFTTLRQFFQIYFESTCFPLYLLGFLDFSVFPPGKITGLMFLHYPLHRFLRLLY